MSTKRQLFIFAKAPRPGHVKTRLAAGIGAAAACAFYERSLRDVLDRLDGTGAWRTRLAVTPDETALDASLWPRPTPRVAQGSGDLGDRMGRLLARASPDRPVVIVGSDIPELRAEHVVAAFEALDRHDLVFGPATDGGYWLIGASVPLPANVLAGIRWSTEHALADTLRNAQPLKVALLEDELEDVDDAKSHLRFLERTGAQP
jgi:rSAM/selenodomain-associated transferase 1